MATTITAQGVRNNSLYYNQMLEKWALLYDLWGGTQAMRMSGTKWLPKNVKESDAHYNARVNRTFLYNAYRRTIKALVGNAFMHDISVSNIPPELEYLAYDADGCGRSLTAIAAELLEHMLITGKAHPIVDFPKTESPVTRNDLTFGRVRPYVNAIDPRDLIGWRVDYDNGYEDVREIRFTERTTEMVDEFNFIEIERVRVIRKDEILVYRQVVEDQAPSDEFVIEYEAPNSLGYVPIVPAYENKVSAFVAEPTLEDLAWLNLRHWQSTSEQNNILHVARVPILFMKGMDAENIEIGGNAGVTTESESADMKYVEHGGNAISAGKEDLKDLENLMSHMGSDILTSKSVARQTAFARATDRSESLSTFQVILRNLEKALERCYHIAGDWINVDASEVSVLIGDDLSIPSDAANPVEDILKLEESGHLDKDQADEELKRRNEVSPHFQST